MNNDRLIEQAQKLYARLHIRRELQSVNNQSLFDRLDYLLACAYCRYLRRFNHCIICYHNRSGDCVRELGSYKRKFCPPDLHRNPRSHDF